jgi:hypothetical protein
MTCEHCYSLLKRSLLTFEALSVNPDTAFCWFRVNLIINESYRRRWISSSRFLLLPEYRRGDEGDNRNRSHDNQTRGGQKVFHNCCLSPDAKVGRRVLRHRRQRSVGASRDRTAGPARGACSSLFHLCSYFITLVSSIAQIYLATLRSQQLAAVLVENQLRYLSLIVPHKSDLRVKHFEEKFSL